MKTELEVKLEKNIERIGFLLSEWINDYSFNEKPDPFEAIKWLQGDYGDTNRKNAAKWFIEYNRIHDLVDMAMDYVIQSETAVKEEKGTI